MSQAANRSSGPTLKELHASAGLSRQQTAASIHSDIPLHRLPDSGFQLCRNIESQDAVRGFCDRHPQPSSQGIASIARNFKQCKHDFSSPKTASPSAGRREIAYGLSRPPENALTNRSGKAKPEPAARTSMGALVLNSKRGAVPVSLHRRQWGVSNPRANKLEAPAPSISAFAGKARLHNNGNRKTLPASPPQIRRSSRALSPQRPRPARIST